MTHLNKLRLPDGRDVWVDAVGQIVAPVRSNHSHEDEKEHRERQTAEAFVRHRGYEVGSLARPVTGDHDFDVTDNNSVVLSIEVKGLTWPGSAMGSLVRSGEAAFSLDDFEQEIRRDLRKANGQLTTATGQERAILVVWSYEDDPSSPWGAWLRANIARLATEEEVAHPIYVTTPRAFEFDAISRDQ